VKKGTVALKLKLVPASLLVAFAFALLPLSLFIAFARACASSA
jgi:hypothetical protein